MKKINLYENFNDYQCVVLTALGFSRRFVSQETKLTPGQCDYRCRLAGVQRAMYRDGRSPIAAMSLEQMLPIVESQIATLQLTNGSRR